jgi:uncharacterized protein YqeY
MSDLKAQLTEDMKNAMRAHDSVKLNTVRFLLSELKNWEIDNGVQDDAGVMKIIQREVKKMKDAIEDFKSGNRDDLVQEENAKVAILESYLPKQMSDEDLMKHVKEVVSSSEDKNFGILMKAVMARVQGQADGGRVSALLKQALAE